MTQCVSKAARVMIIAFAFAVAFAFQSNSTTGLDSASLRPDSCVHAGGERRATDEASTCQVPKHTKTDGAIVVFEGRIDVLRRAVAIVDGLAPSRTSTTKGPQIPTAWQPEPSR